MGVSRQIVLANKVCNFRKDMYSIPAFSFCSEKLVIILCLFKPTSVNHSPALLKKKEKTWQGSGHIWWTTYSFVSKNLIFFWHSSGFWPSLASLCCVHTLQRNNTENSKQIFPEKELHGHSPNFRIHVSLNDLCIPTIGLPILLQGNMWTDPIGVFRSLTDTWMWKLRLRPRNSRKRNT